MWLYGRVLGIRYYYASPCSRRDRSLKVSLTHIKIWEEKGLKNFKVNIIETLQMEVEVEAETAAEAKSIVENEYYSNKYTLDASHKKQVNFVTRSAERSRGSERC